MQSQKTQRIYTKKPSTVPISGLPMLENNEYCLPTNIALNQIKRGLAIPAIAHYIERLSTFGVKEITVEEGADREIFIAAKRYGIECHTKLSKKATKH